MIVYKITNQINGKMYIGITNNAKKRWYNHCCNYISPIGRAIQKYGKENFKFEELFTGLTIEEAEKKEIQLISELKTLVSENGYNIAIGGSYGYKIPGQSVGEKNSNHILTEDQVKYIKNHRNLPQYQLFDEFSEIISYEQFKKIYRDECWKEIVPEVEQYPYNLEFSCQFTQTKFDLGDILRMRELYEQGVAPGEAYKEFQDKADIQSFGGAYRGDTFKLVRPEVFTRENLHKTLSAAHSGEKNGRSKLTKNDVIKIRKLYEEDGVSIDELHNQYPQVSITSIRNVVTYKTWKNI